MKPCGFGSCAFTICVGCATAAGSAKVPDPGRDADSAKIPDTGRDADSAKIPDAGRDANAVVLMPQPPPADPCTAAGTCPPGRWVNVTPASVTLDPNFGCNVCNYGVMDIVADPVRPADFYAFICYQGVWKSTDYGLSWSKVDKGTNAKHIESGRPWTAAIDPNPNRNPNSPPALYTASGYGDQLGLYKSTDGGVNWEYYTVNNTQGAASNDIYALDIDPYDSNHLITGFHSVGLSESKDGGHTWKTIRVPATFGMSVYVWFVRSDSAVTTSGTWLTQAQWNNNTNGMWRTTDSGATWKQVQPSLEHGHGSAQIYQDGKGVIYASGNGGGQGPISRSTDYGQTWSPVKSGTVAQNGVFGTPNYVYATYAGANLGGLAQHLQRTPASDGVNWSDWSPVAPPGMTNGSKRAAVSFDGTHYVVVSGNYLAGIWRYLE